MPDEQEPVKPMIKPFQSETRPLDEAAYLGLRIALESTEYDGANVGLFRLPDGSFEIRFPETMAQIIDALVSDMPALQNASLVRARARAYRRVVDYVDSFTKEIVKQYPDAETMAWPTKQAEARAVLAGGDVADTLILKELVAAMDLDAAGVTALANSVREKAADFAKMSAAIEGLRNLAETQIAALSSVDDVDPLVDTLIDAARAKAVELGFGGAVSSV